MVCQRPHCSTCSNREKIQMADETRPHKRRICHTCSISIEQRTTEEIKRSQTIKLTQVDSQISDSSLKLQHQHQSLQNA